MKGTLVVVALCGLLCSVSALPATSKQIDDSIDFVPFKETQNGDQPIIDTGAGYDGAFSPLSGFLSNMESLMNKIRQQMENVWSRFPTIRPGNFSDDLPDFPNFGVIAPSFDEIDLGKGNTTSETKIIDGHKVVINQTEYHKDTPNGSAFFKVRVIDVQPPNPNTEKDTEESTTPPSVHVIKDREPLENSVENEIYKNKEAMFYQPLQLDHVDSAPRYPQPNFAYETDNSEWSDLNRIEPISDNSLNFGRNPPVFDLSRDTYVNDLLAKSGAPVNPDAEIIEVVPQGASRTPLNKFQYPR